MSDHLGRRLAVRTCPQASRHSWQRPRLHSWLTHQARGWPTAGIGSGTLNTRADSPEATQNVLFCAFATDRQLTAEAAHIGGSVRGQVARRVATFREQHPDPGTPLALSECERWPRRSDFQGGAGFPRWDSIRRTSGRGVRASAAAGRWLSSVPGGVQDGSWDGQMQLDSAGLDGT